MRSDRQRWLFPPGCVTRRVNREAVLLLAGPRALLLQLAHPLVAAGVAEHSTFPDDALGRLRRTLDAMLGMTFGSPREARAIAKRLAAVHARVHGVLGEATRVYPAGHAYDARDPALGLWVWATLVDSSLCAYQEFVGRLSLAEREAYVAESHRVARLLDLREQDLPRTSPELSAYVDAMVASDVLDPTPTARRLAEAVVHPPLPFLPRLAGEAGSVITTALLPPALRARYALPWERRHRWAWEAARTLVRTTLPLLPDALRAMPQAREAERRASRDSVSARGKRART